MWPPRYLLRTIGAVSIPLRQWGASSRAREAHGVQSNSRHVPSRRGARDLAKTRFNKVFERARDRKTPGEGRGLILFANRSVLALLCGPVQALHR